MRTVVDIVVKPGRMGEALEVMREICRCIEDLSGVAGQVFYPTTGEGVGVKLTGYWDFASYEAYGHFTDQAGHDKPMFKATARLQDGVGVGSGEKPS